MNTRMFFRVLFSVSSSKMVIQVSFWLFCRVWIKDNFLFCFQSNCSSDDGESSFCETVFMCVSLYHEKVLFWKKEIKVVQCLFSFTSFLMQDTHTFTKAKKRRWKITL